MNKRKNPKLAIRKGRWVATKTLSEGACATDANVISRG